MATFFSVLVFAEKDFSGRQLPRYEGGLAVGYFHIPQYPGADEENTIFLPLPYFIYRGEVIRADRQGGLRGRFFRGPRFEFDLSFGAAFPADSNDNTAREGMVDLDWIGEVGPRLRWHLVQTPIVRLDFNFPLRHVFSTNFYSRWNNRGFVFNPQLEFRHLALFDPRVRFVARLGATYATTELADYFYTVKPSEATVSRPVYESESGHFGTNFALSMVKSYPQKKVNLFVGVSLNNYTSSVNRQSPLMKDLNTQSYFLGFSYGLFESEDRASEETDEVD